MAESKSNSTQKLPGGALAPHLRARFWITGTDETDAGGYVGVGRITLLEQIEHTGSMNQAAKAMGMSYKKAWKLVDEMNAMFSQPLVQKAQGGKDGGGTQLTQMGQQIIQSYRRLEQALAVFMAEQSRQLQKDIPDLVDPMQKDGG
ncbi:winged helix-turn-helix domain-containing protein [Thiomicrospira sp. WB1]|uniref:winged helix-turn-helix domain-containing protein n=1 Tax=Thiomicrospira sp. WB1 TaxID=1685380 RepID=UPI0007469EA6|nr:winged helix-turn-helix domain-containing protein [Thiomicrospira sp. WB1]KUJ71703.1 ModE family transcriptional regulator [Thiomicrospira sp. WB1]